MKFYTIQNPPAMMPEPKSKLPDECRQSDYTPLPDLLERFIAAGQRYVDYMGAQMLSADEKEALFENPDVADLSELDIAEQKAYIDSVQNVKQQEVDKQPTQPEPKQAEPEKAEPKESA